MDRPENHIVIPIDCRSNTDGKCFYCPAHVGQQHSRECVVRRRSVTVRLSIDVVVDEPESWNKEQIDFFWNESSSCQSNIIDSLAAWDEANEGCACGLVHVDYLREATEADESGLPVIRREVRSG